MTARKKAAKPAAPKRGRGRPPIDNPATLRVNFRVTDGQRKAYQAAAARAGMTLTAWIEQLLDGAAKSYR